MSSLLKWKKASPISIEHSRNPFFSFQQEIDKAIGDFYEAFASGQGGLERFETMDITPSMDIVEDDKQFNVQVEMPGMGEEDIKVSFSDNLLTISGEKTTSKKNKNKKYVSREINYGKYERVVSLPANVDIDKATASFKKGMLWVSLPKKLESKKNARDIKIDKV